VVVVAALALPATGLGAVRGDFDGDGFDDLAIGVPNEELGGEMVAGMVHVLYGAAGGPAGTQSWDQDSTDVAEAREPFDAFGEALVAGNFNGDAYSDLAIGAPGETIGAATSAGAVNVLYGSANGLQASDDDVFFQGQAGIGEAPENSDQFGSDLGAGDLDGDGADELIVGVPFEDAGATQSTGIAHLIDGGATGLVANNITLAQGSGGLPDTPEAADFFATALVAGDFQGGPEEELAIGVQGESEAAANSGAVHVLAGSPTGPVIAGSALITEATPGVPGPAAASEGFGRVLAAGNVGMGVSDDLIIGVPFADVGGKSDAGAVIALFGDATALGDAGAKRLTQDTAGVPGAPGKGDILGITLIVGDLGKSSAGDLAVGATGDRVSGEDSAGAVNVFYGSSEGPRGEGSELLHQDVAGIAEVAEAQEQFGRALALGNFGEGARADLAIGVAESVGPISGAGAVNLLFGQSNGLETNGDRLLRQGKAPFDADTPEQSEFFATALAP
jgi:hypothetical protein